MTATLNVLKWYSALNYEKIQWNQAFSGKGFIKHCTYFKSGKKEIYLKENKLATSKLDRNIFLSGARLTS